MNSGAEALRGWHSCSATEQAVVLEVLRGGPLPRSELARRLSLSPSSLTRLVSPLMERQLLEETENAGSGLAGRPTRPLRVVAEAAHFVGVRLTPREAHGVRIDLAGTVCATHRRVLGETSVAGVAAAVAEVVERLSGGQDRLVGVSLGGAVTQHRVVQQAAFFQWSADVDFGARLAQATGGQVVVDNDVMALTRAQAWFGSGRGRDRFAVITLGVGLGLGLVMNGEVVETPDAGLAQHFPLDPHGPLCPLGHQGCAQAMLTDESVAARTSVALRREISYDEALDLAAAGQPAAKAVVDQAGRALGRLLASVANLTTCTDLILTGEGARLADAAEDAMTTQLQADRPTTADPVTLVKPDLGPDDWAQGAAVLAMQHQLALSRA